jgi:hypothetical protein
MAPVALFRRAGAFCSFGAMSSRGGRRPYWVGAAGSTAHGRRPQGRARPPVARRASGHRESGIAPPAKPVVRSNRRRQLPSLPYFHACDLPRMRPPVGGAFHLGARLFVICRAPACDVSKLIPHRAFASGVPAWPCRLLRPRRAFQRASRRP